MLCRMSQRWRDEASALQKKNELARSVRSPKSEKNQDKRHVDRTTAAHGIQDDDAHGGGNGWGGDGAGWDVSVGRLDGHVGRESILFSWGRVGGRGGGGTGGGEAGDTGGLVGAEEVSCKSGDSIKGQELPLGPAVADRAAATHEWHQKSHLFHSISASQRTHELSAIGKWGHKDTF